MEVHLVNSLLYSHTCHTHYHMSSVACPIESGTFVYIKGISVCEICALT